MNFIKHLIFLLCVAASAQTDAVIRVDATRTQHEIPRTIYGSFLEPIGRSIYGGVWAQVLENPSFEDNLWSARRIAQMISERKELSRASQLGLPLPWEPLDPAQESRFEPRWGDMANSYRSLLIMALPGAETGVRQQVYLPVHRTLRYTGSIWLKHESGPKSVTVSLRSRERKDAFASQSFAISDDWKRYEFALELPRGSVASLEPVDFVIAASNETRVLVDQAFLMPADHIDGMNPEMIAMLRAMKSPVMRYGGNYTSGYHWRDGVGHIDKRVTMLNQAWGMPEYNHFGTDEYLRLCELVGAEPQIALNLGSGTPNEAADWVRYVNSLWGDKKGGLLWELGNELWGLFQIGYPTLPRIAARTREFSEVVRKMDRRARLIATGQDPDRFRDWNAQQLALGPDAFNYLSTHFVVGTREVVKPNASREFIAQAALALPVGLEVQLRAMKEQIDSNPSTRGKVKIAFTEWLFHGSVAQSPMFDNFGGALCTAGFLNTLMRVADFTPIADMTGNVEFGGVWQKRGRVYGVPAYWAFRMYSNADSAKLIATDTQVERYDVEQGSRRIPNIRAVPYLDVVSTLNAAGNKLTMFCVNRHLSRALKGSVQFAGFTPAKVRGQQLTSADLYAGNNAERPEAIVPVDLSLKVSGAQFEHKFPATSVTVIEFSR